jgi:hypothetical protein
MLSSSILFASEYLHTSLHIKPFESLKTAKLDKFSTHFFQVAMNGLLVGGLPLKEM